MLLAHAVALIGIGALLLFGPGDALFSEGFDDDKLPARGWYDNNRCKIASAGAFEQTLWIDELSVGTRRLGPFEQKGSKR